MQFGLRSSSQAIPCQAATAPAAFVASPAANHIQVGSSEVQGSENVHSGLPTLPNHRTCLQPNFAFICHPTAGPMVHEDTYF